MAKTVKYAASSVKIRPAQGSGDSGFGGGVRLLIIAAYAFVWKSITRSTLPSWRTTALDLAEVWLKNPADLRPE